MAFLLARLPGWIETDSEMDVHMTSQNSGKEYRVDFAVADVNGQVYKGDKVMDGERRCTGRHLHPLFFERHDILVSMVKD